MRTILMHRGGFGTTADGDLRAYAVSQGIDSPLSILDSSGRRIGQCALPGSVGAWGILGGRDGTCYIGSYYDGQLYRWDGHEVHELGRPTEQATYVWDLNHLEGGTVIGGTYPDASVFSYHPDSGFRTLHSFADTNTMYLRSLCFDPDRRIVWCSVGVSPSTVQGIRLDEPDARPRVVSGIPDTAVGQQLCFRSGRLFLVSGDRVWCIDPDQFEARELTGTADLPRTGGGHLTAEFHGAVYLVRSDSRLLRLELTSLTLTEVAVLEQSELLGSFVHQDRLWLWLGHTEPEMVEVTADHTISSHRADVTATPPHMLHVLNVPESSDLMLSAGQQGQIARWNPDTDHLGQPVTVDQIESWCWHDGLLYAGTYPKAAIIAWDPRRPTTSRLLDKLHASHLQSRPIAIAGSGQSLFVGTTPGYGLRDGALTRIDLDTQTTTVHMMADESVHAIARDGNEVLVGTSPEAGTGAPVRPGQGRLLRMSTDGRILVAVPSPHEAITLGAIAKTTSGWWLMADQWLCQFDPNTLSVMNSIPLDDGPSSRSQIIEHNRQLYVRSSNTVRHVDPTTLTHEVLAENCLRMTIAADRLWCLVYPDAGAAATDLLRIDLD